jgi:hypothetical protein
MVRGRNKVEVLMNTGDLFTIETYKEDAQQFLADFQKYAAGTHKCVGEVHKFNLSLRDFQELSTYSFFTTNIIMVKVVH